MKKLTWPATLIQGHAYRARIQLPGGEAFFANAHLVSEKFASEGFDLVRAIRYADARAEGNWPTEMIDSKGAWYVEGVWMKPTQAIANPSPEKIKEVWEN